jgi:hypothetical protein
LGFLHERPDKQWKEGPDNLWALREGEFILFECKSEVELTRAEISKYEAGQMNNAAAWFDKEYPGTHGTRVIVIPPFTVAPGAGFNQPTVVLRVNGLQRLASNVRAFFVAFRGIDLRDTSDDQVQRLLDAHELGVDAVRTKYYDDIRTLPTRKGEGV